MASEDISQLGLKEIREELKKRGLETTGVRIELVNRLTRARDADPVQAKGKKRKDVEAVKEEAKETVSAPPPTTLKSEKGKVIKIPKNESSEQLDAKKKRAEKFHIDLRLSDNEKKKLRGDRFGTKTEGKASTSETGKGTRLIGKPKSKIIKLSSSATNPTPKKSNGQNPTTTTPTPSPKTPKTKSTASSTASTPATTPTTPASQTKAGSTPASPAVSPPPTS